MKAGKWVGVGVIVSLVVVTLLVAGWMFWERRMWRMPAMAAPIGQGDGQFCDQPNYGMGSGMMSGRWGRSTDGACDGGALGSAVACDGQVPGPAACNGQLDSAITACGGIEAGGACTADGSQVAATDGATLSIEDAHEAVERYVESLGYDNLEIDELMEFELNFYAIVAEADTGTGAMELLVDKRTGAVGPEIGPNMMWNARYGMHRRGGMMGGNNETNTVSEEDAVAIAQKWLDKNRAGATTEGHADPFYGYYTIHTLKDGDIDGMLSVHGTTGRVWYHSWHGDFVQMLEGDEH